MSIFFGIIETENEKKGKQVSVPVATTKTMKVRPMRGIVQVGVTTKNGRQSRWIKRAPASPGQQPQKTRLKRRQ